MPDAKASRNIKAFGERGDIVGEASSGMHRGAYGETA